MRFLSLILFSTVISFHFSAFSQEMITTEMRNLEINQMLENFSSLGWMEYADLASFPQGVFNFDQVFITENSQDLVMIKFLGPTAETNFEKIVADEGLIFNFTTRWGNRASMYVETGDAATIEKIQSALGMRKTSRWEILFPRANAVSGAQCSPRSKNVFAAQAAMVESCFWQYGGAFGDDVKGKASAIWENIKNPKSLKYYWNAAKKQLAAIKTAILEIQKSVPEFIEGIKDLKLNVQTDIICAWVGSLMPDILIGVATGAGVAKLVVKLTQSVKLVKELNYVVKGMKKMENVIPEKAQSQLLTGAIRCGI
jgi:hypothetical protein